jgi:hypothetical protein
MGGTFQPINLFPVFNVVIGHVKHLQSRRFLEPDEFVYAIVPETKRVTRFPENNWRVQESSSSKMFSVSATASNVRHPKLLQGIKDVFEPSECFDLVPAQRTGARESRCWVAADVALRRSWRVHKAKSSHAQ